MLLFKTGRTKTASLRKVKKLHQGTERPAASKGQETWKLRKAAPGWAVMRGCSGPESALRELENPDV